MKLEMMNCLLIDDDPNHATILEEKLRSIGINKIKVANNFKEANLSITSGIYNFFFIDFYLDNGTTCLDLDLVYLTNLSLPTIYLSSFYDNKTFDKLPKGKNMTFLQKNCTAFDIKKEIELLTLEDSHPEAPLDEKDFIFVKKRRDIVKIMLSDLEYIEVDGKYLNLVCLEATHVIRMPLTDFHLKLPTNFIKIHQSFVVNINYVKSLSIEDSKIQLHSITLPISRSHKKGLLMSKYFS